MIIWLYRIICGYLNVRFYGEQRERILSLCAANGITLWNSRFSKDSIESCILVRNFKKLRKISKGRKVRLHIIEKKGLPFLIERYKKRFGIVVGALLFFLIIELMSGYIWIIDVNGNEKVKDAQILAAAKSIGIHEGIKKNSITPKVEREKLLLKLDSIAWASLNIEGSRLTINVTETKKKEESKNYSNLKASADGIIEKIEVTSGNCVVRPGDAVKKGDLLVSGIIETADSTRFVNSKGSIIAKTYQTLEFSEEYTQTVHINTGKQKKKTVLEIFGVKLPLYLGFETEPYESSKSTKAVTLFGQNLPIRIHTKKFKFYKENVIKYKYEKLCERLEKKLLKELDDKDYEILKKEFSKNGQEVVLTAQVQVIENIAYEDILLFNTGN